MSHTETYNRLCIDVSGTTALLAAISFNQVSCVEWLINNGADVNLGYVRIANKTQY
jgi:ankyrin repeat protein